MQLTLRDSIFQPLPGRSSHYVPVLQYRSGELDALAHLPGQDWRRVTPVLCIVGPQASPDRITDSAVSAWAKRLTGATQGHPFYVDMVRLAPSTPVAHTTGVATVIKRVHERLRRRDAVFLPVYRDRWDCDVAAEAVREAHDLDGRGFGLRLGIGSTTSGGRPDLKALSISKRIGVEPVEIDLMIDLGHLDWDTDPDIDGLTHTLEQFRAAAEWRNIVLLGTTIPSSFSKSVAPPNSVTLLPRVEREVFLGLRESAPDACVTYGDFAVQHPDPPLTGGGPGMRANIRYTTGEGVLIARGGRPVLEVGNDEYPDLCSRLVHHRLYEGSEFSWGDRTIRACADGDLPPSGQPMWRAAGTSHHLQQVLRELRSSTP